MREKIWFIEQEVRIGNLSETEATDQILGLFREEISKLKPLSDEEIRRIIGRDRKFKTPDDFRKVFEDITQAQLDAVKKELEGK